MSFQCQEGSLYLPPPVEEPDVDVVASTVLPIGRSGDGTDRVEVDVEVPEHQHHHDHDDPLGWLRDSVPGDN